MAEAGGLNPLQHGFESGHRGHYVSDCSLPLRTPEVAHRRRSQRQEIVRFQARGILLAIALSAAFVVARRGRTRLILAPHGSDCRIV